MFSDSIFSSLSACQDKFLEFLGENFRCHNLGFVGFEVLHVGDDCASVFGSDQSAEIICLSVEFGQDLSGDYVQVIIYL